MLLRFAAAVAACLLLAAPASAAQSCMKWEDGVRTAAEFSRDRNDRIAAVLLTAEETAATWNALFPGKEGPHGDKPHEDVADLDDRCIALLASPGA